jgi:hypothetical protein
MKHFTTIAASLIVLLAIAFTGCKDDGDTTPPEITVEGYNPYTVCVGSPYIDQGATATDNEDGDLTDQIIVSIDVDTSQESEGTVTYEVSDAAGNTATAIREVIVIFCD